MIGCRDVSFICGRAGVCALGAVIAKYGGDDHSLTYYLSRFKEVFWWHSLAILEWTIQN